MKIVEKTVIYLNDINLKKKHITFFNLLRIDVLLRLYFYKKNYIYK